MIFPVFVVMDTVAPMRRAQQPHRAESGKA